MAPANAGLADSVSTMWGRHNIHTCAPGNAVNSGLINAVAVTKSPNISPRAINSLGVAGNAIMVELSVGGYTDFFNLR